MLDILIRNGLVVDGSGAPRFPADVAIEGDRIADVGRLASARAETIIDAAGQMVTPGFVDMHSHSDMSIPILPTADSLAHQGITTVLFGQCGASPAPLFDENRASVIAALESSFFRLPWDRWASLGSFLDFLEETRC